jgi:hypothetical protein
MNREKDVVLIPQNVRYTTTSLDIPPGLTYDEWENIGSGIGKIALSVHWAVADWLTYGEHNYGEKYVQAADACRLEPKTLKNIQTIGLRYPPNRRRKSLSFSHHAVVAFKDPEEQDHWLDIAERKGLSKADLEKEIKDSEKAVKEPDEEPEYEHETIFHIGWKRTPEAKTITDLRELIEEYGGDIVKETNKGQRK